MKKIVIAMWAILLLVVNVFSSQLVIEKGYLIVQDEEASLIINLFDDSDVVNVTLSNDDILTDMTKHPSQIYLHINVSETAGPRELKLHFDDNTTETLSYSASSKIGSILDPIDDIIVKINDDNVTVSIDNVDLEDSVYNQELKLSSTYLNTNGFSMIINPYNYSEGLDAVMKYDTTTSCPVLVSYTNDTYAYGINEQILSGYLAYIDDARSASSLLSNLDDLNTLVCEEYSSVGVDEILGISGTKNVTVKKSGKDFVAIHEISLEDNEASDIQNLINETFNDYLFSVERYLLGDTGYSEEYFNMTFDKIGTSDVNYTIKVTYSDIFGNSAYHIAQVIDERTEDSTSSGSSGSSGGSSSGSSDDSSSGGSTSVSVSDSGDSSSSDSSSDSGSTTDSEMTLEEKIDALEETDSVIKENEKIINEIEESLEDDPEKAEELVSFVASNQETKIDELVEDIDTIETIEVDVDLLDIGIDSEELAEQIEVIEDLKEQLENLDGLSTEEKVEAIQEIQEKLKEALVKIPKIEEVEKLEDVKLVDTDIDELEDKIGVELPRDVKGKEISEDTQIKRELVVYDITDRSTNKKSTKSKITIGFVVPEDVSEINIVEVIPKEIALHVDEIDFAMTPIVINPDPTVMWELKDLIKGESVDLSYIVDKEVEQSSVESSSAGIFLERDTSVDSFDKDKSPITGKAISTPNVSGTMIFIGVFILLVVVLVALNLYKKKK